MSIAPPYPANKIYCFNTPRLSIRVLSLLSVDQNQQHAAGHEHNAHDGEQHGADTAGHRQVKALAVDHFNAGEHIVGAVIQLAVFIGILKKSQKSNLV